MTISSISSQPTFPLCATGSATSPTSQGFGDTLTSTLSQQSISATHTATGAAPAPRPHHHHHGGGGLPPLADAATIDAATTEADASALTPLTGTTTAALPASSQTQALNQSIQQALQAYGTTQAALALPDVSI